MKRILHFSARALRAIVFGILVLIVGIIIFLNSNLFDSLIKNQMETRLSKAISRPITVDSVAFNPFRLSVHLKNLKIGNDPRSPKYPMFSAGEIYARVSLRQLFSGRLQISEVRVKDSLVSVFFYKEGGTNWPSSKKKTEKKKKGGVNFVISKVDVSGMTVIFDEMKVPVSFQVKDLDTQGGWDTEQNNYLISTTFNDGYLKIKDYNFFKFDLRSVYRVIGDRVVFERLHFISPRSKFWMAGDMYTPTSPFFDMRFRSVIDLEQTKEMFKLSPVMSGTGRFHAVYKGSFKTLRMKGEGTFNDIVFYSIPIDTVDFQMEMTDNWLNVSDIRAQIFGGPYTGTFSIDPLKGHSIFRGDAKWRDWDGRKMGRFVRMKDLILPVRSSGTASVRWEENGFRDITGDIKIQMIPNEAFRMDLAAEAEKTGFDNSLYKRAFVLPFATETEFQLGGKKIRNLKSHLETLYTTMDVNGTIDFTGEAALNVVSHVEKIAEVDLIFHYLQAYFKNKPVSLQKFWAVRGSADFEGTLDATVWSPFQPRLRGQIQGKNIRFHNVPWDTVTGDVLFHKQLIQIFDSSLALGNATATAKAKFFLEDKEAGTPDALDVMAQVQGFPATEIAHAFNMELPVYGKVNATLNLKGPFDYLEGESEFEAFQGEMWGEKWDRATGTVLFFPDSLGLRDITAYVNGGYAKASGDLQFENDEFTVQVDVVDIPLERLTVLKTAGLTASGIGSAHGTGSGTFRDPHLSGDITITDLKYKNEYYGNVTSNVRLDPGIMTIVARGMAKGIESTMKAEMKIDGQLPFDASFNIEKFPLELFTRAYSEETGNISGLVGGDFQMSGTLRPAGIRVLSGALDYVQIDAFGISLHQARPLDVRLSNDVILIEDSLLVSDDVQIAITGKIFPKEKTRLDLSVSSEVNLAVLSKWDSSIFSGGDSSTRIAVTGTLEQPLLTGVLEIKNGFFRQERFPNSLTDISALVTFKNRDITLESLKATSSGGTLTAGGSGVLKGVALDTYRLDMYADKIRMHYPEGLRSTVSGELHVQKKDQVSFMTGDIEILQGIYTRSFEESPDVFRYARVPTFVGLTGSAGAFQDMSLNVRIHSAGNLIVRNNFADIDTEANLNITGTFNDPVVTGRVDVRRGEITFREREYDVLRGSLNFANPYRTEPQLNFSAETRIREYRITLNFNGTFDRIYHDITSDPPLARDDLYTLLGVGNTPAEIQGVDVSAVIAGEEISRFITSPIASPLERGFRKAFGLQRFHISPTFVQSTQTATARITLEKDLSKDLSFTYSTNLFTVAEEVFLLRYQLTDQVQIAASKDELNRYGIDVLVTQTFE